MSGQQQARKRQIHSADVRQVYERVLAGASVRSCHVEVAGDRVHVLEKSAGSPVVLLHGTENSARFLLAIAERTRGGPRDGDRPARGRAERPDRPPTKTLPRDRGRMAGQPARRSSWTPPRCLGTQGAGGGAVVRNPLTRAGVMRLVLIGARIAQDPLPVADPTDRHPRDGRAAVAVGATQPEIGAAVREVRGREGDPCRSPGLGRLDGGHGPGPDRRRKRQGRDTRVGRAVHLAVAFWVPASFQRATRRAAPAGNGHAGGVG
jgi:hypothetical protein